MTLRGRSPVTREIIPQVTVVLQVRLDMIRQDRGHSKAQTRDASCLNSAKCKTTTPEPTEAEKRRRILITLTKPLRLTISIACIQMQTLF